MAVNILATAAVINRYRTPASPKFRQLFFSFWKVCGYPHCLYRDSLTLTLKNAFF